jgi:uncharacterized damage-inducible protein DinB
MPSAPFTHATLIQALTAAEAEVAAFFESLSDDEFVLRQGTAWSPAGHLAHLNISVSATARGFSIPKLLLRFRFGRSRRPSRTLDQLTADYLTRLASGAGATGRFVPAPDTVAGPAADVQRSLLSRWRRVNDRLRAALMTWSERDLDRLRLPHPLLGLITARELVFFTIHHGPHHVAAAKRRLPRFAAEDPA